MNLITKAHLEGVEALYQTYFYKDAFGEEIKTFLTTYGINLLKATKESVEGKKPEEKYDKLKHPELRMGIIQGHNSCHSSFISAIDEGIKEINKGI